MNGDLSRMEKSCKNRVRSSILTLVFYHFFGFLLKNINFCSEKSSVRFYFISTDRNPNKIKITFWIVLSPFVGTLILNLADFVVLATFWMWKKGKCPSACNCDNWQATDNILQTASIYRIYSICRFDLAPTNCLNASASTRENRSINA